MGLFLTASCWLHSTVTHTREGQAGRGVLSGTELFVWTTSKQGTKGTKTRNREDSVSEVVSAQFLATLATVVRVETGCPPLGGVLVSLIKIGKNESNRSSGTLIRV